MTTERTLNPMAAHNALGAALEMYTGIIADYERSLQLANAQQQRTAAVHAEQLKAGKEVNQTLQEERDQQRAEAASLRHQVEHLKRHVGALEEMLPRDSADNAPLVQEVRVADDHAAPVGRF